MKSSSFAPGPLPVVGSESLAFPMFIHGVYFLLFNFVVSAFS